MLTLIVHIHTYVIASTQGEMTLLTLQNLNTLSGRSYNMYAALSCYQ